MSTSFYPKTNVVFLFKLQGVRVDDDDDEDSDDEEIDMDNDEASEAMSSYFNDMNQELSGTKVASGDCDEWTKPMNIDSTVLKNLLESFKSQDGMAGPASTLLEPLGIRLDKNSSSEWQCLFGANSRL